MLTNWDWILFDADDTLFHFDAYAGLRQMFLRYKIDFTREDYSAYQAVNKPLWVEYQNGAITALQLQHRRFAGWAEKLRVEPQELNQRFLEAMAEICHPLPGAISLLNALKDKVEMGIITNGFSALQQARLARTGLLSHFKFVVISEQVGVAKPHPAIFDHALELMGHPPRQRVMMVGDNPDSDILGAMNAGFASCWLNATGQPAPEGIRCDWEVSSLSDLHRRLLPDSPGQG
ncbi:noncanonical pyrimidine nucleotidase, YjjG family [Erwinia sp. OLTSP20]|uniref:pyrimidine 5'-nucleotidase n=1 Tax=unclassified Erwinia TaxID=2622719 RepID=UPI000C1A890C|nr:MULTISPECIES: pyrimidine 5'-nucleotidase [unclassified Erwinia]PIJ50254.1 noncanonical pyrimidine nucleotidase, YjjG family [Erwinia sp. OAMSP11]PIJ72092.1 noncanonical pyrimidine nucleotidase, YjjG family [Erwinia sp. OLSSP12]PIJ81383.1 noncanonical pyrimidine nucleotidase, YjjG family [Erwinia sp. OLCASP19]PIJ84089.1 noncanonical pyrimidine nucleotidase, YjjG family [Erwinia sp. OLMTSP26]PIJ85788.1 noncanonical pyrimidine nucleotidase, YjjG family [Erwinia sp. OLMDSP33]